MIDYSTFLGPIGTDTVIDLNVPLFSAFATATLDSHPEHRSEDVARDLGFPHAVAPPTLAFVITLGGGTSHPLPFPLEGFLHVDQALDFQRPLTAGETLTSHVALTRARHRGGEGKGPSTWILSLEGILHDGSGGVVARSASRLVHRQAGSIADGAPAPEGAEERSEPAESDFGPTVRTVRLTPADLRSYAEASGDPNPIHTDDRVARQYGLPGVIAHGMLTMALLAQAAEDEARAQGAWVSSVRCRFLQPVLPGEPISIHVAPGPREGAIALSLTGDGPAHLRVRGDAMLSALV